MPKLSRPKKQQTENAQLMSRFSFVFKFSVVKFSSDSLIKPLCLNRSNLARERTSIVVDVQFASCNGHGTEAL